MKINNEITNNVSEGFIWFFIGYTPNYPADYPCGVFSTIKLAERYILKHKLSGTLIKYPIGMLVYDYVIAKGWWTPKLDYQREPRFIQRFSSSLFEHYDYEDGHEVKGDRRC